MNQLRTATLGDWRSPSGLSLPEVLVALSIFSMIVGSLGHFVGFMGKQRSAFPRQSHLELRARQARERLEDLTRSIGTGVVGPQAPEPAPVSPTPTPTPGPGPQSQFAILWAQPYDLLVNGDRRPDFRSVPAGQTIPPYLTSPGSGSLGGYSAPELAPPGGSVDLTRAETFRLSLDGNRDGLITAADKSGGGAPAIVNFSINPSDYVLQWEAWYCEAGSWTTLDSAPTELLVAGIRAWTEATDTYPGGDRPPVLFSYWLDEGIMQEDLNGDADRDDLLLFGDDGSGGAIADNGQLENGELVLLQSVNGLGGVGRAVSEAGLSSLSGPDTRLVGWRTQKSADGFSAQRITRILNRSITRISVRLRVETGIPETGLVSRWSIPAQPYYYREASQVTTLTIHDLAFAYPHTRRYY